MRFFFYSLCFFLLFLLIPQFFFYMNNTFNCFAHISKGSRLKLIKIIDSIKCMKLGFIVIFYSLLVNNCIKTSLLNNKHLK